MKFKEVIKLIRNDGWYFVRQTGSHKQFHYKQETGTTSIVGKLNDNIHPKHKNVEYVECVECVKCVECVGYVECEEYFYCRLKLIILTYKL